MPSKEPVEISCSECSSKFRLWVPQESMPEWERGVRISCVRCGSQFFVRKSKKGFEISALREVLPSVAPEKTVKEARKPAYEGAARQAPAPAAPTVAAAPPPPEPQAAPLEAVLIVEDDRLSRDMVENTLGDIGMKIVPVKNSTEALKAIKKERVTLVVTDLYLRNPADPEAVLDGEELLKRIHDSGVVIPAIITTGKDIIDDLVLDPKWFDLQVKGFIQKGNPFWVEELKLKVKEVIYKG